MAVEGFQRKVLLVESASARPTLPDKQEVFAAFRGQKGRTPGDHLITRWAQNLGHLHRFRHINPGRADEIDHRREQLVVLIDGWIASHLPARSNTPLPTQSLGAAVDEMAGAFVVAELVLETDVPTSAREVHDAWSDLGFLATAWTDLVAEVVAAQPWSPPCGALEEGE
ncbi:DUF4254 domain-containing protein [Nocardia sp. GCM10030253]|uniref:DUF4254 domain-containing protein n=1 Tax=Nocardia sp. GCM10030253 TaxID=3273404 RepID=UPI003628AF4E